MPVTTDSETLEKCKLLLCRIAYPSRGSDDERMDIYDAARMIQAEFSIDDLAAAPAQTVDSVPLSTYLEAKNKIAELETLLQLAQEDDELIGPFNNAEYLIAALHSDDAPAQPVPAFYLPRMQAALASETTEMPVGLSRDEQRNFIIKAAQPVHNDHPMRHWDRTCPACIAQPDTYKAAMQDKGEGS